MQHDTSNNLAILNLEGSRNYVCTLIRESKAKCLDTVYFDSLKPYFGLPNKGYSWITINVNEKKHYYLAVFHEFEISDGVDLPDNNNGLTFTNCIVNYQDIRKVERNNNYFSRSIDNYDYDDQPNYVWKKHMVYNELLRTSVDLNVSEMTCFRPVTIKNFNKNYTGCLKINKIFEYFPRGSRFEYMSFMLFNSYKFMNRTPKLQKFREKMEKIYEDELKTETNEVDIKYGNINVHDVFNYYLESPTDYDLNSTELKEEIITFFILEHEYIIETVQDIFLEQSLFIKDNYDKDKIEYSNIYRDSTDIRKHFEMVYKKYLLHYLKENPLKHIEIDKLRSKSKNTSKTLDEVYGKAGKLDKLNDNLSLQSDNDSDPGFDHD